MVQITQQQIEHIRQLQPTLIGKITYACIPYRRKVILNNMNLVCGELLTPDEIKTLARCYYGHFITSIRETIHARFTFKRFLKGVRVEGIEHALKAAELGKGLLILTGHFGSWEVAPIAGLLKFKEYAGRFHFIRKTLPIKWVEKLLFRNFFDAGIQVIEKKHAIPKVLKALEKNDAIVFVLDQAASIKNKQGVLTEFFNHPVGTYRSLATIARSSQAPVIPGTTFRLPDGSHVMRFLPPLAWIQHDDPKEEIILNTNQYNQVLEQLVLDHPEQWLWIHRRWKKSSL